MNGPNISDAELEVMNVLSFLDRVFGGQATPMLVHFVEIGDLSDDDLASLREILERSGK